MERDHIRAVIEEIARAHYGVGTTHDIDHVSRVAADAETLCAYLGGSPREQLLAFLAGFTHDWVRMVPNHPHVSARALRRLLPSWPLGLTKEEITRVLTAVSCHGTLPSWRDDPVRIAVFLADKKQQIEGVIWRRNHYLTEVLPLFDREKVREYWKERKAFTEKVVERFGPILFTLFPSLADEWKKAHHYMFALLKDDPRAWELVRFSFRNSHLSWKDAERKWHARDFSITASAPVKVILFGEHFVVYGLPALAIPISRRIRLVLKKERADTFDVPRSWKPFFHTGLSLLRKTYAKKGRFSIQVISSDLPKGLGRSASIGAALSRAFFAYHLLPSSPKALFEATQLLETRLHGTRVSGIDAMTVVTGTPILFEKKKGTPRTISFNFSLPSSTLLLIVHTLPPDEEPVSTKAMLARFSPSPSLFSRYRTMFTRARALFRRSPVSPAVFGDLLNRNHELLREAGVSDDSIEIVRNALLSTPGVYGAKLTGAGGRGCALVALIDRTYREEIQQKFPHSFPVHLADRGVSLDA